MLYKIYNKFNHKMQIFFYLGMHFTQVKNGSAIEFNSFLTKLRQIHFF